MKLADTLFLSKLHDTGIPLTETDISAFENELSIELPADYRKFLLLRNGGFFYEPIAFSLRDSAYADELVLNVMFSLLEPAEENGNDLRHQFDVHEGRIPRATLPIASDGDNLVLMDLRPAAGDAISLWLRDNEMMMDAEDNRITIAGSFFALAAACRTSPEYFANDETAEPFRAIERYDLDILIKHLDSGIDPDSKNDRGTPLLVLACRRRNYDAARILLTCGANVNKPDRRGSSALKCAAESGARDLVKLLLDHGAIRHLPNDPSTSILNSLFPPPGPQMAKLLRSGETKGESNSK